MSGYVQYRGEWLPANYTNYLVANGVVIASSYGNARFDNAAKVQLQKLFPTRDIVMTDTRELWYNGGAVHCVTNDQPLLQKGASALALKAQSVVPPLAPIARSQDTFRVASTTSEPVNNSLDTNGDGIVSPIDALAIINVLHRRSASTQTVDSVLSEFDKFDVNLDGLVTSLDALLVVNYLNRIT